VPAAGSQDPAAAGTRRPLGPDLNCHPTRAPGSQGPATASGRQRGAQTLAETPHQAGTTQPRTNNSERTTAQRADLGRNTTPGRHLTAKNRQRRRGRQDSSGKRSGGGERKGVAAEQRKRSGGPAAEKGGGRAAAGQGGGTSGCGPTAGRRGTAGVDAGTQRPDGFAGLAAGIAAGWVSSRRSRRSSRRHHRLKGWGKVWRWKLRDGRLRRRWRAALPCRRGPGDRRSARTPRASGG
jgi:hypothetical protein